MTKEEIQKHINWINRIDRAKEIVSELHIDWETDIEMMDFSKLYNFPLKISRIMSKSLFFAPVDPGVVQQTIIERDTILTDWKMSELIEFVKEGNKIIPPSVITYNTVVDGIVTKNHFYLADGSHRQMLSAILGLKIIPFVKIETYENIKFSIDKWSINYQGDFIVLESPIFGKRYEFVMNDWEINKYEYRYLEFR
ncbi:hypothetical protein KCV26_11795 [Petrimonas sulfuriphila]|uniref:hypothetical protein n=1 Tax=Petrimonas sulfuriphila TaxID=285070 RepID=UPI00324E37BA